jgi:hypothetical protein
VAMHALQRSLVDVAGERVLIGGAGPIGLVLVQLVRAMGARDVVVVKPNPFRGALAGTLGATVLAPEDDVAAWCQARSSFRRGFDPAFDCSGAPGSSGRSEPPGGLVARTAHPTARQERARGARLLSSGGARRSLPAPQSSSGRPNQETNSRSGSHSPRSPSSRRRFSSDMNRAGRWSRFSSDSMVPVANGSSACM